MNKFDPTLIVFTRYPEPGRTKTRLAGVLGDEGAARLHRRMAEHTLDCARSVVADLGLRLEVHHTAQEDVMVQWLGEDLIYRSQTTGDLGQRMAAALAQASSPAVIIGTDCPDLDKTVLVSAFTALHNHDLVLGPAADGGYYLIGLNQPRADLFRGVDWGGNTVMERTLDLAARNKLRVKQLVILSDIDRPEDLPRAQRFLHSGEKRR